MDPFYSDEANDVTNGETGAENVTPPKATEIPIGGEVSPSTYSQTTHEATSPQVTNTLVHLRSLAEIYAKTEEVVGIEEEEENKESEGSLRDLGSCGISIKTLGQRYYRH
ncbi:hypothetical protein V6N13_033578 [Hibiscus sabdariffa]